MRMLRGPFSVKNSDYSGVFVQIQIAIYIVSNHKLVLWRIPRGNNSSVTRWLKFQA